MKTTDEVMERRLRWFGPLLASRISGKIFTNRAGSVEVVDVRTCSAYEREYASEAICWIHGGEMRQ